MRDGEEVLRPGCLASEAREASAIYEASHSVHGLNGLLRVWFSHMSHGNVGCLRREKNQAMRTSKSRVINEIAKLKIKHLKKCYM